MYFGFGAMSLSRVDAAFNVFYLSGIDIELLCILVCRFPSSPLFTCSSSDLPFHFHLLAPVSCGIVHAVNYRL